MKIAINAYPVDHAKSMMYELTMAGKNKIMN